MRPALLLPTLSLLLLPACAHATAVECATPSGPTASGLTYATAVGLMCDVDRKAGISDEADPVGVGLKRTAWMMEHADHPDAIELRVLLSVKEPSEQARMLREQAKEVGLGACALADTLEKSTGGGIAP
jgi:hypothetical protein